ncbi:MAG: hypothetical protein ACO3LE_11430 [Bdellovibrionota bacterium]
MKKRNVFNKEQESQIKKDVEPTRKNKLEDYIKADEETYTAKKANAREYAVGRSKEPELIAKTRMAMGYDKPIGSYDPSKTAKSVAKEAISRELGEKKFGDKQINDKEFSDFLAESRQDMDELADQYKRERRGMKKGGMVKSSASKRADGCAVRGKTRGRMV